MPVFQVQDLIDRAAAQADMHDDFVKPAEWLAWYNSERRALQIFMARHGAAMQDLDITSTTAPDVVTISGEFLALVGVWETRSGQLFRQLKISPFPNNFFQQTGGPITGPSQFVTVEDDNTDVATQTLLRFYPRDPSGTYVIVKAKAPAVATSATSTTSLPMGIEERIVVGMAKRALIKEESDYSAVQLMINEQDRLIEEYVSARGMAQGMAVRNVDNVERSGGWQSELLYPEVSRWYWL